MKPHGKQALRDKIQTSELAGVSQGSSDGSSDGEEPPHFHPEFGRFMLEATPARPWGIDFKDLLKVESNMKLRYVRSCEISHKLTSLAQA